MDDKLAQAQDAERARQASKNAPATPVADIDSATLQLLFGAWLEANPEFQHPRTAQNVLLIVIDGVCQGLFGFTKDAFDFAGKYARENGYFEPVRIMRGGRPAMDYPNPFKPTAEPQRLPVAITDGTAAKEREAAKAMTFEDLQKASRASFKKGAR